MATAALRVASVASKQLVSNGKITSWTSLASAAINGAVEVAKTEELAFANAGLQTAGQAGDAIQTLSDFQNRLKYVTPWVQLAETAIRNDGRLQPADWVSAVGSTLDRALTSNFGTVEGAENIGQLVTNVAIDGMVAGALSLYDRDAALSWLESTAGAEVGNFIGRGIREEFGGRQEELLQQVAGDLANSLTKPEQMDLQESSAPGEDSLLLAEDPFTAFATDELDSSSLADEIRQKLTSEGATAEQIEEVFATLGLNDILANVVEADQTLDRIRNQPILLASVDPSFMPDQRTTLDTLIATAAPLLETIGDAALGLSEKLDSPFVRFALIALDIAGGPIKFAVREAIMATPAGDLINDAVGLAFHEMTSFVSESTGLDEERAGKVVVGALAIGGAAILGGKFLRNKLDDLATAFRNRSRFANSRSPDSVELPGRETLSIRDARRLEGEKKGLIFVREPQGNINARSNQFDAGTEGAASDLGSGSRTVPALRFKNPASKSNPLVNNFIKFDGIQADGVTLIDRKLALTTFPKQIESINRAVVALEQNPGFRLVYEFPDLSAANRARDILQDLGIRRRITIRVAQ